MKETEGEDLNYLNKHITNLPFLLFSHLSAITSASLDTIVLYSSRLSPGDLWPKWYTRGACWLKPSSMEAGLSTNNAPAEKEKKKIYFYQKVTKKNVTYES